MISKTITSIFLCISLFGLCNASDRLLTYDNHPLGSKEEPLVFRTYVPDLGLDDQVMTHHHRGYESPKYSVQKAEDHPTQTYKLLMGLPAAIAVSEGKEFSYVWDTLECRLIYSWEDGFLDMQDYWGNPLLGSRKGYGYTSKIYGKLFYQAKGKHPLSLDGKSLSDHKDLTFVGHRLEDQKPVFIFQSQGSKIEAKVEKGEVDQSVQLTFRLIEGQGELKYKKMEGVKVKVVNPQSLLVKIEGKLIQEIPLKEDKQADEVSKGKGKRLFANMGCNACHTLDGTKSHGPSFQHLYGSERELADGSVVEATAEYLKKSISDPNAQLVKGYPPNFMPTFGAILKDPDLDSLVMYIQSISMKD